MRTSKLSIVEIARQATDLINRKAAEGLVLPRTFESVLCALRAKDGYAIVIFGRVVAYAECKSTGRYFILCSVVAEGGEKNARHGLAAIKNRLSECYIRNARKKVILACSINLLRYYEAFGFMQKPKQTAPICIRGGRTDAEWMSCDREWMLCTISSYLRVKETGSMAKKNMLIKVSGDVLYLPEFQARVREYACVFSVVVLVGGGTQIEEAFKAAGYERDMGPLGRKTKSLPERQIARDVLEVNQAGVQDMFDDSGISVRVEIPVLDIGGVLCHVNGDVMVFTAYNGYDRIIIMTTRERVEAKLQWLAQVTEVFQAIGNGKLDKIEVIGF